MKVESQCSILICVSDRWLLVPLRKINGAFIGIYIPEYRLPKPQGRGAAENGVG